MCSSDLVQKASTPGQSLQSTSHTAHAVVNEVPEEECIPAEIRIVTRRPDTPVDLDTSESSELIVITPEWEDL